MSETLILERIESNLTRLRLSRIREVLQETVRACEQTSSSYLGFLDELL